MTDEVDRKPIGEACVDYHGVDGGGEEGVKNVDCSIVNDGRVTDF